MTQSPKVKTRREVLIEAGVPADELAKVQDATLDSFAFGASAGQLLHTTFVWKETPQGHAFWYAILGQLVKRPAAPPKPPQDWKAMAERLAVILVRYKEAGVGNSTDHEIQMRCYLLAREAIADFNKMMEGENG